MPAYRACLKEIIPWKISLTALAKSLRDDPADSHDRRSLEDVAALKTAQEDCYGAFGVREQGRGFLYVPFPGSEAKAALLLKYLDRASGKVRALWLVDREPHYPGIGPIFGCSAGHAAILCDDTDKEVPAKEVCTRLDISWARSAAGIAAL